MVNICGGILHARMGIVAAKTRHTNRGWWAFRGGVGSEDIGGCVPFNRWMTNRSRRGFMPELHAVDWRNVRNDVGCPIVTRPAIGSWDSIVGPTSLATHWMTNTSVLGFHRHNSMTNSSTIGFS